MNLIQRQFLALYEEELPEFVMIGGRRYRRVETFKYDFFAGTGLYELSENPVEPVVHARLIVVKIYRYRRFFGLPTGWFGKLSVRHEARMYLKLADIRGIPRFEGFVGKTGFAHEYIDGRPLKKKDFVSNYFFDQLKELLSAIHRGGVSYVDLHKPSNILLGKDGKPYLIDFQISYAPRLRWWISNFILTQLQTEDWYHYLKHKRRMRRDLLTQEDYEKSCQPSAINRIHRRISKPYFRVRHYLMEVLGLKSVE